MLSLWLSLTWPIPSHFVSAEFACKGSILLTCLLISCTDTSFHLCALHFVRKARNTLSLPYSLLFVHLQILRAKRAGLIQGEKGDVAPYLEHVTQYVQRDS